MLPSNYMCCKNCIYSVKMPENWMCSKLFKIINPEERPCVEGRKRYDIFEISMAKMDSEVQQMDMPPHMP